MPIALLSSQCHSSALRVAETIAETAAYSAVDRTLLPQAAQAAGCEEKRLVEALDRAPSLMGMSSKTRKRALAYVEQATLGALLADEVVCHGLAAHLYVEGVSHALKVRVLGDEGKPSASEEQNGPLSGDQGGKAARRVTAQQKKWSLEAYGIDETEPAHYDLVVDLSETSVEQVGASIAQLLGERKYQPVHYSIGTLRDLELASRVRVALLDHHTDWRVRACDGTVVVEVRAGRRAKRAQAESIKELARTVEGVEYVEVHALRASEVPPA